MGIRFLCPKCNSSRVKLIIEPEYIKEDMVTINYKCKRCGWGALFTLSIVKEWKNRLIPPSLHFYYKNIINTKTIGQVIETSIIKKNVNDLERLSNNLSQLVSKIKSCNDELNIQISNIRDIELTSSITESKKMDGTDLPIEEDVLEKT